MSRSSNIDFLKTLGIISVICIHSFPEGHLVRELSRWAVPFFFIISGYFHARNPDLVKSFSRILTILLFWSAVYITIPRDLISGWINYGLTRTVYWHFLHILENINPPINLIFHGVSGGHLWFLSVLLIALALYRRSIVLIVLILSALGLLSGHLIPIFTGLFFFNLGAWIQQSNISVRAPEIPDNFFSKCGQYSLGLYAGHIIIKESLEGFLPLFALVPLTFLGTLVIIKIMEKNSLLKKFIK